MAKSAPEEGLFLRHQSPRPHMRNQHDNMVVIQSFAASVSELLGTDL